MVIPKRKFDDKNPSKFNLSVKTNQCCMFTLFAIGLLPNKLSFVDLLMIIVLNIICLVKV